MCDRWFRNNCQFHRYYGQKWTPSFCNVLKWIPMFDCPEKYFWTYDVLTHLNPSEKRRAQRYRSRIGLVPIYPGDRQYPRAL